MEPELIRTDEELATAIAELEERQAKRPEVVEDISARNPGIDPAALERHIMFFDQALDNRRIVIENYKAARAGDMSHFADYWPAECVFVLARIARGLSIEQLAGMVNGPVAPVTPERINELELCNYRLAHDTEIWRVKEALGLRVSYSLADQG